MSRSERIFIISFILLLPGVSSLSAQSGRDFIEVSNVEPLPFDLNSNADFKAAENGQLRSINNRFKDVDFKNFNGDSINADQLAEQHLTRLEPIKKLQEEQLSEANPEQLIGIQQVPLKGNEIDQFTDQDLLQQATDYFKGHESKLQEAQNLMSKLKKKYRSVPNSNDLSTAIKRSSLSDQSFNQRIVPGLNFQILQWDPFSVDLSPNLMYLINTRFSVGIAVNLRASFDYDQNANNTIPEHVYGGSLMSRHLLIHDFFLYNEVVWLSTKSQDTTTDNRIARSWHPGLLLGIGKRVHFSDRLKGRVIFTYDLLHQEESPAPRAWNIKFGIQAEQLFKNTNKLEGIKN